MAGDLSVKELRAFRKVLNETINRYVIKYADTDGQIRWRNK